PHCFPFAFLHNQAHYFGFELIQSGHDQFFFSEQYCIAVVINNVPLHVGAAPEQTFEAYVSCCVVLVA
ncbi:hypothetical protein, partial [Rhizobium brockwellii]|uniref:hypothetical protein n=1 Tax=Rhizobium brockwellii TaxID=3019932 RepID=UPI003F9E4CCE